MTDKHTENEIWTEKYRPKSLDEVIDQKHVVGILRAWVKNGSIPNMLFAGPAGVGKRSLVHSLALIIAEDHAPQPVESVVAIAEPALLADASAAVQAGRRKAGGGVLFLPNIQRFFWDRILIPFQKEVVLTGLWVC